MKTEYITEIEKLLQLADIDLLDYIYQLLQKSIETPINSSIEHPQSA